MSYLESPDSSFACGLKHSTQKSYGTLEIKITEVDSRLLDLKPPSEMKRTPRSMESTHKFWKGKTHATSGFPKQTCVWKCMCECMRVVTCTMYNILCVFVGNCLATKVFIGNLQAMGREWVITE